MNVQLLSLAVLFIVLWGCENNPQTNSVKNNKIDTVNVIQTVLNYPEIKNDYIYFPNQSIKLIENKIIKSNYKLLYRNKPADIIKLNQEEKDIGATYPKKFYVGISSIIIFSRDSLQVNYISYAGSGTSVFTLKKDSCSWNIVSVVHGKF